MKAIILIFAILSISIARDHPVPTPSNPGPRPRPGHYPPSDPRPRPRPGHYPPTDPKPHPRPGHYPATDPRPHPRPGHYPSSEDSFNTLSAHHARPSLLDIYHGFSTKLGLTQEQQNGLQLCAADIRKAALPFLAGGKAAVQAKLLSFIFADDAKHREVITTLIEKAQTALPQCRQFVQTFASVFDKATTSATEEYIKKYGFKFLARHRLQSYSSEIISALVTIFEDAGDAKGQKVGEGIAYIVQLITGLIHPQSTLEYQVEKLFTKRNEPSGTVEISVLEPNRLLQQTINNAAKELGVSKQITEEQAQHLINTLTGLSVIIRNTQVKLATSTSSLEREVLILGGVRDIAIAGGVALEQVRDMFRTLAPEVTPFAVRAFAPVVIRNYFVRLPTIHRRNTDLIVGLGRSHAVESGKALAAIVKALTDIDRL